MAAPTAPARPLTPGGVLLTRPVALVGCVLAAAVLTAAVLADRLAFADDQVADGLAALRSDAVDAVFRAVSELGGGAVVLPLASVCAVICWRRWPALGAAVLLAVAARYGVEELLKEAVGRERPAGDRIVEASGPAFPSGHVLGATVGWGLVPAAVRAVTDSARAWAAAVGGWAGAVVLVAASRVYLGVHWFSDTVGSLLFGLLVLALVDVAGGAPHR